MTKKIVVVSRFVPRGSPLTHISVLRREEHLLPSNKQRNENNTKLYDWIIENREFEWEFPTFLSKFGFIGFIGLMEIQCMYVRVRAARIRERKGDRNKNYKKWACFNYKKKRKKETWKVQKNEKRIKRKEER